MEINKFDKAYLKMALTWSELSYSKRKKVGAILVKDNTIISDGYNGTPSKYHENICENEHDETYWYVLHGEANAIMKCAKNGISCKNSILYQTLSPCKECSKLIVQAGISKVFYIEKYRNTEGIDFLIKNNVEVEQIEKELLYADN